MTKDDRIELAAIREQLLEAVSSISEILEKYAPKPKKAEKKAETADEGHHRRYLATRVE